MELLPYQERLLAHKTIGAVSRFYQNPDNITSFEKWHLEKYGRPYQWREGQREKMLAGAIY